MGLFLKTPVGFLKKKVLENGIISENACRIPEEKNILENGIISENACRIPEKKTSWRMGLFLKTPIGFLKKKYPEEWDYFRKRLSDS